MINSIPGDEEGGVFIDDYLLSEEARAQLPCENCKTWGRTLTEKDRGVNPVLCPECKRPTWPTLGVNLPAGCAWALAGTASANRMRHAQRMKELDELVEDALGKAANKVTDKIANEVANEDEEEWWTHSL